MILFFVLTAVVFGLQFLHRSYLRQLLPSRWKPWIGPALLILHAPLACYMVLRLGGLSTHPAGLVLRPLARAALFFQVLTVANLLVWAVSAALWRFRAWVKELPTQGPEDPGRRMFMRGTAGAGLGLLAATSGAGFAEAQGDPDITRLDVPLADLPAGLDGLRIAHLTDLHAGPLNGPTMLRRWRALAEGERPDLLVITGDLVDSQPDEIAEVTMAFRAFPAPLGRFAILGNHDYFYDPQPIWEALESASITCLENRHAVLQRGEAELTIFGLQDPAARRGHFGRANHGPGPMPQDVALRMPPSGWRLGLVHRPSNWDLACEAGARLTLAGHTHGGQINLVPGVNSANLLGPYTNGLYRQHGRALYVSRGLGVVALPIRLGAPPEIAILTLRRAENPTLSPA